MVISNGMKCSANSEHYTSRVAWLKCGYKAELSDEMGDEVPATQRFDQIVEMTQGAPR